MRRYLEESLVILKENNKMLHEIRGSQRRGQIIKALYWAVIIAVTVGGYLIAKPYLDSVMGLYTQNKGVVDSLKTFNTDAQNGDLQELLKTLQGN